MVLHFSNEYINKVFAGAWFRSNFEDLLSYRGANKLEWFEVLLGADCSPVPATGKSQFSSNFLTGKTDDHRITQENLQNSVKAAIFNYCQPSPNLLSKMTIKRKGF